MSNSELLRAISELSEAEALVYARFCANIFEKEEDRLRARLMETEIENRIIYKLLKRLTKDEEAAR